MAEEQVFERKLVYKSRNGRVTIKQFDFETDAEFEDRVFRSVHLPHLLSALDCDVEEVRIQPEYWAAVVTFSKSGLISEMVAK